MDFDEWNIIWTLTFGVVAAMAVIGNIVTVVIFLKRQLRTRPRFLLISLAVADLLVGLLSIPLYVTLHYDIYEGPLLPAIAAWMDMFTGLTSIFTLAAISLERMYAIGWPFRHRSFSSRTYIFAIAIPWILALTAASTEIVLQYYFIQPITFITLLFVYLSSPIVVTCIAYSVVLKKGSSQRIPSQAQEARDLKLAKTMGLITGAFLVTWLPLQIIFLVFNLCISCPQNVSLATVYIIKLLQFGNSVINVFIYHVRVVEYRTALLEMLSSLGWSCRREQLGLTAAVGASNISLASIRCTQDQLRRNSRQTSRLLTSYGDGNAAS